MARQVNDSALKACFFLLFAFMIMLALYAKPADAAACCTRGSGTEVDLYPECKCSSTSNCPSSHASGDYCLYGTITDCTTMCDPPYYSYKRCEYQYSQPKSAVTCDPQCQTGPSCTSYPGGWNCLNVAAGTYCDYYPCIGPGTCPGQCNGAGACVQPTPTPTPTPVPCTDTDSGINLNTKGTCTSGTTCTGSGCTDFCVNEGVEQGTIDEYYCLAGKCESTTPACPAGTMCSGGRCISLTPTPTPTPAGPCTDTDNNNVYVKGMCTDAVNPCNLPGCLDNCVDGGTLDEVYCNGDACTDRFVSCSCSNGACVGGGTPAPTSTPSSGCAWWSSSFGVCASGCPPSTSSMAWVCCETSGAASGCPGDSRPGCAGYRPTLGETPCCSSDGYQTCSAQEECVAGECINVCTDPSYSKYTDPYCAKCDHCVDGLLNCGEPTIDKCGASCLVPADQTCNTDPYLGYCSIYGQSRCDSFCGLSDYGANLISTTYVRQVSCAYDDYACICECAVRVNVFNKNSCYDGVQNCGEPCLDGGPNCAAGTENGIAPVYDVESPLADTVFYVDENILCSDGIDNDQDCVIDCADPDCAPVPACQDTMPPIIVIDVPLPGATIWNPAMIRVSAYDDRSLNAGDIAVMKDGVLLHQFVAGECTGAGTSPSPYRCTWSWPITPPEMGARTLHAEARDWKSNLGTSSAVSVTVGCASTFDCTTMFGANNYCSMVTHLCNSCVRDQDFYCPDVACIGVDLDCCSTTVSCPAGLYCDIDKNTCYAKHGNLCTKQDDCAAGDYCSLDAQVCVSRNFLFLKPHFLKAKLGTTETLQVFITDPVNRTGAYDISISGTGKNYAKFFGTQNKIRVALNPGEVKVIPLRFSAGAIGQYALEVEAIDAIYYRDSTIPPGGIRSISSPNTKASVTVETEVKTPFLVSSPGPAIPGLLALALLASLFISCGGRKK